MPRKKVRSFSLDYLSILDEEGKADEDLLGDISDDLLTAMHKGMLRAHRLDERMLELQREGRLGTFAPLKGQEAAEIGAAAALNDDDWIAPSYREQGVALWRGLSISDHLVFTAGYNEGLERPEETTALPSAVPVGTQPLHAVGLAYAMKLKEAGTCAVTFFGDGATSQGDFHEAMNFATALEVPTVFFCQNNQYAISVPRRLQSAAKTLAQKGIAYEAHCLQVDGNDVLAVYTAMAEAVKRAREKHEVTLIEALTYRREVHTTADDPTLYREDEEVEKWAERDPIQRMQAFLKDRGLLDDEAIQSLEDEISEELETAWSEAEERMTELDKQPLAMFDHMFAEPPPELERQRAQWKAMLEEGQDHG